MSHVTERPGKYRGKRRAPKRARFYRSRSAMVVAMLAVLTLGA